ncbi:MAG: dihydrofolate reductase family protein [Spirochaetales bacterium]|nr:dihydrofolate reductase family protein [Spirochaetales bacterium]
MGLSKPNPPVACVIETTQGQYFSGGTEPVGGRHAEIVALDAYDASGCQDPFQLYVTLEPCSRQGRTGPCSQRLKKYRQLKKIVFFHRDPTQRSLEDLSALCPVERVDLSSFFLQGFLRRVSRHRPRLFFKVACSKDGFIAPLPPRRSPISGREAGAFVQLLRSRMGAVVVGGRTIQIDQPQLNYRIPPSFDLPRYSPLEGESIFLQSMFEYARLLCEQDVSFLQPLRIGCLNPSRPPAPDFIRRQKSLPGPFLTFDSSRPPLEFLSYLSELACNDVLLEGGAGLFRWLEDSPEKGDVIILLQSKEVRMGSGLKLPSLFQAESYPVCCDLGQDLLFFREIS